MHSHFPRLFAPALLFLFAIPPLVLADDVADRTALEATSQAWIKAFNERDVNALIALTTEDVVLLDPSVAPASGREAALRVLEQAVAASKDQVTTATKEIVVAGDIAWRIGALTHRLPNGDVVGRGQSLEIWKRVNGKWKVHRQMSSSLLVQPRLWPRPPPSGPVLDTPRN
jgi:ketosteroid isomerase-like protein